MTQEPVKTPIYSPEVIADGKIDNKMFKFRLHVPQGQEWLYAMQERQIKTLDGIHTMITIILLLVLLSAVAAACSALGLL